MACPQNRMSTTLPTLTERYVYPKTEMNPASIPIRSDAQGWMTMSAIAPTATPPARVAF